MEAKHYLILQIGKFIKFNALYKTITSLINNIKIYSVIFLYKKKQIKMLCNYGDIFHHWTKEYIFFFMNKIYLYGAEQVIYNY